MKRITTVDDILTRNDVQSVISSIKLPEVVNIVVVTENRDGTIYIHHNGISTVKILGLLECGKAFITSKFIDDS